MAKYVDIDAVKPRIGELIYNMLDTMGIDSLNSGEEEKEVLETVAAFFDVLPADDVAPVIHSEWVYRKDNMCYCPECGFGTKRYGLIWGDCEGYRTNPEREWCGTFNDFPFKFCPNCGAKMDGESSCT